MWSGKLLLVSLLAMGLVAACSDSGDDGPTGPDNGGIPDPASFSLTVRPILRQSCATTSCHGSAVGQGGLAFGTTNPAHAQVVTITSPSGDFVVPGSSATSNLYLKVIPVVPNPPGGARMPASGGFLSTAHQDAIKRWIDNGALDN
ncbi:MAG: hypothetical protein AB1772_04030 [Candidatus Zixiibacteriota bacterium]